VSELDAIYYMVSTVFGYGMKHVVCTYCGYSHLDKDWFSLHAHRRHLCAGCGRHFRDNETAIGNPICHVRNILGSQGHKITKARRKLEIRQADYPGGIQIWGSNPAFLWTGNQCEEEGIHVHAFGADATKPAEDDTFSEVVIDDVTLDPSMVRILMAQRALPHLAERVVAINCASCNEPKFAIAENAITPSDTHICSRCNRSFPSKGRLRKVIGNPLVAILDRLAAYGARAAQKHELGLLPETI
jgi:transposase-like protein